MVSRALRHCTPPSLDDRGRVVRLRTAGAFAAAILLSSCGSTPQTADPNPRSPEGERAAALAASVNTAKAPEPAERRAAEGPYRIGARDLLEIVVLGEPEWPAEAAVRPDGKISYVFLGDVEAAGRTVEELREELRAGLARYVKRPQVSVAVREFRSRLPNVYVAGEVRAPGAFELAPPHDTFLDAILAAGGETPDADLALAYVVRRGEVIAADFDRLLREGDRGGNFVMSDGDFVYFPRKDFRFVYVLGQVLTPGAVPAPRPIKLLEAVAEAGGLARTAFKRDLKIIRGGLVRGEAISVDFERLQEGDLEHNLYLNAGDIVFAPRTALTAWNDLVLELVPSLSAVLLGTITRREFVR